MDCGRYNYFWRRRCENKLWNDNCYKNQFDLVILKSDDFPRGSLGFHYYTSIGEIQDKLELLYPFVKNAGQVDIEKVFF